MEQRKRAAAPAVMRAAALLGLLAEHPGPQRLSDIAASLDLALSSTASLCNALENSRMIRRTAEGYVLGPRLVELAHNYLSTIDPLTSFSDVVASSSVLRHQTVQLAMLDDEDVLYLARRDADRPLQISSGVGKRLPNSCTAVGKAMLAALDAGKRVLPRRLPALTSNSITSREELLADLERTAERGYAIDDEETSLGVICLAVAVNPQGSDPRYGIGVTILKVDHSLEFETALVNELRQVASTLGPGR